MTEKRGGTSRAQFAEQLRAQLCDHGQARQRLHGYLTSAGEELGSLLVDVDGAFARLDQEDPAAIVAEICNELLGYFRHVGSRGLSAEQRGHVEWVSRKIGDHRRQLHAALSQIREARKVSATWAISPPDPDDPPAISDDEVVVAEQLVEKALARLRWSGSTSCTRSRSARRDGQRKIGAICWRSCSATFCAAPASAERLRPG